MMNNAFMPVTPLFNHNDVPVMNPSVKCVEFDIARNTLGVRDKIDADDHEVITTVQRGTRKPGNRAIRRKNTINAKRHTKRIANYAYDLINPVTGKIKDSGWKSYLKGEKKVYVRNNKPQYEEEDLTYAGTFWYDDDYDLWWDNDGVVEVYDEFINAWVPVPEYIEMIEARNNHIQLVGGLAPDYEEE